MNISRVGSQPSTKGADSYFTGNVRVDPLYVPNETFRSQGAYVTFEPGARTAWHSHPIGQILIVTAGCGQIQLWGEHIQEIHPGDVVWIAPGEKHWHGATATTSMTHISIVEQDPGQVPNWQEKVTEKQFLAN
jgi:quercetin dioxygenase-like cupin family protein